jgi:hypothetical protein
VVRGEQLFDFHRIDLNWQYSVPVLIDDSKNYPNFEMTRCTYFTIECDEPSPGWVLGLREKKIAFHLISLSGIIFAPSLEKMTFDSQEEIEKTFTTIEDHPSLFIDINDVWLPNFLISGPRGRGAVLYTG